MPTQPLARTCPFVLLWLAVSTGACTGAATDDTDGPGHEDETGSSTGAASEASDTGVEVTSDPSASTGDDEPPTGTAGDSSTGSTSSTGETDDEPAPYCSDGTVDPGEECDDGLENSNEGACTLSCEVAVCGDGLLWLGHEGCDDGNDDDSDACVEGCVPAACGDGFLFDGNEECEPGDIDDNQEYVCGMDCKWSPVVAAPRVVFLSSVKFSGDMSIFEPSLGDYSLSDFPDGGKTGVLLADARCQALAALAELAQPSTFHAWLSDNNGTDISSAVDRIHPNASPELQAGYMLPGGPMIATSFASLAQGLMAAILEDEHGVIVSGQPYVWSNTSDQGEALGLVDAMGKPTSCESWHSPSPERGGQLGWATDAKTLWTDAGSAKYCNASYRLYCFQEG